MSGIYLVAAFVLALMLPAKAQQPFSFFSLPPRLELPVTKPWVSEEGEHLGTATRDGNRIYMRNLKGEHVYTAETDAKGVTLYDPSGNIVKHSDR